jgi:hypothetical protein
METQLGPGESALSFWTLLEKQDPEFSSPSPHVNRFTKTALFHLKIISHPDLSSLKVPSSMSLTGHSLNPHLFSID